MASEGLNLDPYHKKALQSNNNHPTADSMRFIVNRFEHVWSGGSSLYSEVQVEKVWAYLGVDPYTLLYRDIPSLWREWQTDIQDCN